MILDLLAGHEADEARPSSGDQPDRAVAHLDRESLQRSSAGHRSARQRLERALRTRTIRRYRRRTAPRGKGTRNHRHSSQARGLLSSIMARAVGSG